MARREQPDHYALLQVSPRVSAEELAAAYQRLEELYSPDRTHDAAPELQSLAAEKREQLAQAYAVLSDTRRRAIYDRQHGFGAAESAVDYAPLPPARGQERAERPEWADVDIPMAPRPRRERRTGPAAWIPPLAIGLGLLALLLLVVLSGVRTTDGALALATPTISGITLPATDAQLAELKGAAEQANTAESWKAYGDALFDNLQTLREQAPQSPQYRGLLPLWLDVAQAYERSLALSESATVRADRAVALFNYGKDAPAAEQLDAALAEVERGVEEGVSDPRALLNYGLILSQTEPPRRDEAFALWRKVREVAPESQEAQFAERLLASYGQS